MPSPNIWHHLETYELEVSCFDPDGLVDLAVRSVVDLEGRDVLDIGCGAGAMLPGLAAQVRSLVGVEPHAGLAALAARRTAREERISVRRGTAQRLPVADHAVDVAHARWAYFFGPGCEPGQREIARVLRRGGTAVVVDNDPTRSTFGRWFRVAYPAVDPSRVEAFWSAHGWSRVPVTTRMSFARRADLEAVLRIELDPRTAEQALAEHAGCEIDYAVNVWFRHF